LVNHYTIAVDVMGGDYGPEASIPASLMALKQYDNLELILVGDETVISNHLEAFSMESSSRYRIHHASQRVEMDESPVIALRHKTDSSMRISLNLVHEGVADACVSAGNTGALMAIARFVLKTLPGIDRPAISALIPTVKANKMVRVLDLGANVDIQVDHLLQFALMGLVLSTTVDKIPHPKLGLLNIELEQGEGNRLLQEAGELFKKYAEVLNYVGYLEGDALFEGEVDVVVCDGFTGNVALKVMEGVLKLVHVCQNQVFKQHWISRLAGLIAKPFLQEAEYRLDPNRYNGASLVGLQGIVVKSHGKADAQAFNYALQSAMQEIEKAVPQRIQEQLSSLL